MLNFYKKNVTYLNKCKSIQYFFEIKMSKKVQFFCSYRKLTFEVSGSLMKKVLRRNIKLTRTSKANSLQSI